MNQKDIGQFIYKCRKEKGLTQAQLAETLNVSDKSISRWENGKTMPDLSLYEPLCNTLDIQISELLYGKKMNEKEKLIQGDRSAMEIFKTKSELLTFGILTELLILVGIIITITLTKIFAKTIFQTILIMVCGGFVWAFGIILRIKIKKAISFLEKDLR